MTRSSSGFVRWESSSLVSYVGINNASTQCVKNWGTPRCGGTEMIESRSVSHAKVEKDHWVCFTAVRTTASRRSTRSLGYHPASKKGGAASLMVAIVNTQTTL
eukprot:scaffold221176_cov53-Attheya_sp.AAC.2